MMSQYHIYKLSSFERELLFTYTLLIIIIIIYTFERELIQSTSQNNDQNNDRNVDAIAFHEVRCIRMKGISFHSMKEISFNPATLSRSTFVHIWINKWI